MNTLPLTIVRNKDYIKLTVKYDMSRAWQRTELQYGKFIKHTNNRDNNTILNWLMKPNAMAYR